MSEREEQIARFRKAVDRKSEQARQRSQATAEPGTGPESVPPVQAPLVEDARGQDVLSPRAKNSGKGKKTADKWNQ